MSDEIKDVDAEGALADDDVSPAAIKTKTIRLAQMLAESLTTNQVRSIQPSILASINFSRLLDVTPVHQQLAGINAQLSKALNKAMAPVMEPLFDQVRELQASLSETLIARLNESFKPVVSHDFFRAIELRLLPPNLREASTKIRVHQVQEFLESEGIPLWSRLLGRWHR